MAAIVFIPLSKGKVAIIDFDDMEKVGRFRWYAINNYKRKRNWYAIRTICPSRKIIRMHNAVMSAFGIDHKNGDGLDNRKENLRLATPTQNTHAFVRKRIGATSNFRGVSKMKNGKWIVHIRRPAEYGKRSIRTHVGCFNDEEEAAKAYDNAAIQFGYFPEALNFNSKGERNQLGQNEISHR